MKTVTDLTHVLTDPLKTQEREREREREREMGRTDEE
jgi:hypothetical protein